MTVRRRHALAIVLLAAAVAASTRRRVPSVTTEDRNGDGRPDVWRTYDAQGRLAAIAIDTNFDGRTDVEERYDDGALVERDVDRDFDRHIDVKQIFDPAAHALIRTVIDSDGDGLSDLLVLFQNGRPVYSEWVEPEPLPTDLTAWRGGERTGDELAPLVDVFGFQASIRARAATSVVERFATPSRCRDLPRDRAVALPPAELPLRVVSADDSGAAGSATRRPSPRGPPVSMLHA
jgi:hypothetical protein